MWNNLKFSFITLILLLFNSSSFIIHAEQIPEPMIVNTLEGNLTGDNLRETIQLKGNLLKDHSNYYQDLWVEIKSPHSKKWKIPLKGGYDPNIELLDLNQDHIDDLFYQSIIDKSNDLYSHHLYSLKKGVIKEIALPNPPYIKGHFENGFQVEIQFSIKNDNPVILNVKDSAKEYINLGLYDKEGKLLKPLSIVINPIFLYEPILISTSKGYGLKSFQNVNGAHNKDDLGTIETLWYYENDTWITLDTNWIPSK